MFWKNHQMNTIKLILVINLFISRAKLKNSWIWKWTNWQRKRMLKLFLTWFEWSGKTVSTMKWSNNTSPIPHSPFSRSWALRKQTTQQFKRILLLLPWLVARNLSIALQCYTATLTEQDRVIAPFIRELEQSFLTGLQR